MRTNISQAACTGFDAIHADAEARTTKTTIAEKTARMISVGIKLPFLFVTYTVLSTGKDRILIRCKVDVLKISCILV
jgi:hypothetical protein